MFKKNKNTKKFFITHLAIIIPVLLTSILATNIISYEILKREKDIASYQLENTKQTFLEQVSNYKSESVLITSRMEMTPKRMDNPIDAYDSIEILKLKNYFDNEIYSVFLTYKENQVFSQTGISSKKVYFSKNLDCMEESVNRGIAAVESEKDDILLLKKNEKEGYLLYNYQSNPLYNISCNFLLSFDELKDMFYLQYNGQYYELEMSDGTCLVMGNDAEGNKAIISEKEWAELVKQKKFIMLEDSIEEQGIHFRLYFDCMTYSMSGWLKLIQVINILLITIGTVLSMMISWFLSKKRIQEVQLLESIARGDAEARLSSNNVYSTLQNAILNGVNENQKLSDSLIEHKVKWQDKTAFMIFNGLYKEYDRLYGTFLELGFKGCPEKYFVGAISIEPKETSVDLSSILDGCLVVENKQNGQNTIYFLYELALDDGNQLQRKALAVNIRSMLYAQGLHKVFIGMSQVYTNAMIINCAYNEAVEALKQVLSGKRKDFCFCWDQVQSQSVNVLLDEETFRSFDRAMQEKNLEEALKYFHELLYRSSTNECSIQNRLYLRYEMLQRVVSYLKQEKTMEHEIILKECINIRIEEEKEFTNTIISVLHKCLIRKEDDSFSKMLQFINENYQNNDLTFETVAEVGGISKTYLSKVFRTKLGMSYIEYLTEVRIDRACTLLRTTDINVNVIAEQVGYANAASFRRIFKEKFGISASDYRKREKKYQEEKE